MTLDDLDSPLLKQCLHDTFTVRLPDGAAWDVELVEVTDLLSPPGNEQFSACFRDPAGRYAPQGIYSLEHPRIGAVELFLVPIRDDQGIISMEATFNRFTKKEQAG